MFSLRFSAAIHEIYIPVAQLSMLIKCSRHRLCWSQYHYSLAIHVYLPQSYYIIVTLCLGNTVVNMLETNLETKYLEGIYFASTVPTTKKTCKESISIRLKWGLCQGFQMWPYLGSHRGYLQFCWSLVSWATLFQEPYSNKAITFRKPRDCYTLQQDISTQYAHMLLCSKHSKHLPFFP